MSHVSCHPSLVTRMWYDITRPIHSRMPIYPGDPEVEISPVADFPAITRLTLGSHTGTHVDAPKHLSFPGGVDEIPLEQLCGPARVVLASDGFQPGERLLLKGPVSLDASWTDAILASGVRLVGVEGMSIEEGLDAHARLLGAGLVLLEGLDLREVPPGEYELYCLPLKLAGGDGAPARAVLHA